MLKKILLFTIATMLPLIVAFFTARITANIFPPEMLAENPDILGKVFITLFSPAMIVILILVILFWQGPYWTTETVNWSNCFSMHYLGFMLLITKMIGTYGIGIGILAVTFASITVARRLEENRWRNYVVGAYEDS